VFHCGLQCVAFIAKQVNWTLKIISPIISFCGRPYHTKLFSSKQFTPSSLAFSCTLSIWCLKILKLAAKVTPGRNLWNSTNGCQDCILLKWREKALELLTKTVVQADHKHRTCHKIRPNQGQTPTGFATDKISEIW